MTVTIFDTPKWYATLDDHDRDDDGACEVTTYHRRAWGIRVGAEYDASITVLDSEMDAIDDFRRLMDGPCPEFAAEGRCDGHERPCWYHKANKVAS